MTTKFKGGPIAYLLTSKAERALAGDYHPMSEEWVPSMWACADSGPLTPAEAADVLRTHGQCGAECRIGRTARKVRARLIDAPTVRTSAFRRILAR